MDRQRYDLDAAVRGALEQKIKEKEKAKAAQPVAAVEHVQEPVVQEEKLQLPPVESVENIGEQNFVAERIKEPRVVKTPTGELAYFCHEGVGRDYQEDRIVINTKANAFASIDGMGGEGNGDQAAQILAEELHRAFNENSSVEEAQVHAHERMKGMNLGSGGACYAAARIEGNLLKTFSAGDVELLVARDGKIVFRTEDEGAVVGPGVYNAVQGSKPGTTQKGEFELKVGDKIIAASDGFWDNLDHDGIAERLSKFPVPKAIKYFSKWSEDVMQDGGKEDNVNVIIYSIDHLEEVSAAAREPLQVPVPDAQEMVQRQDVHDLEHEVVRELREKLTPKVATKWREKMTAELKSEGYNDEEIESTLKGMQRVEVEKAVDAAVKKYLEQKSNK